jgi:hypothetical protein
MEFSTGVGWYAQGVGDAMASTTVSYASTKFCVRGGVAQQGEAVGYWLGIDHHGREGGGQIADNVIIGFSGWLDVSTCAGEPWVVDGNGQLRKTVLQVSVRERSASDLI